MSTLLEFVFFVFFFFSIVKRSQSGKEQLPGDTITFQAAKKKEKDEAVQFSVENWRKKSLSVEDNEPTQ